MLSWKRSTLLETGILTTKIGMKVVMWEKRLENRDKTAGRHAQLRIRLELYVLKAMITALRAFINKLRKGTA